MSFTKTRKGYIFFKYKEGKKTILDLNPTSPEKKTQGGQIYEQFQ